MKRNKCIIIIACIFAILLIGGRNILCYYIANYITADLEKEIGQEITGSLNRPECGWYQLYSYYLRPDTALSESELYLAETDSSGYEYRLSLLEFNLAEYADGELDEAALENIRNVFERFAATKLSVIVRFLYDWDGLGLEKEPDDIAIIERHMAQAGAILNEYSSLIYTTQGIFVGSWAEMHDSKYLSDEELTKLVLQYASSTSSSIYLAVRTPNHYRTVFRELESHPERYISYGVTEEELQARLGLFNDGMLGSVSDTGTYQKSSIMAGMSDEAFRKEELAFQNKLCVNVPNGGEAVNDNFYNDWENAIADLAAMHVSYLNQMYDSAVIDKWKNSIYTKKGSIYDGKSAYDYITDHLGARFVLRDCSLSYKPFQKGPATGNITIANTGFSNLYYPKHFMLSLVKNDTGQSFTLLDSDNEEDEINPCLWNSQESVTLPFSFSPFDLDEGRYTLLASLREPASGEIVSFANEGFLEDHQGYRLGTIAIRHYETVQK